MYLNQILLNKKHQGKKLNNYNSYISPYIYIKKKKIFYFNLLILYKLLKIVSKTINNISKNFGIFLIIDIKNQNLFINNSLKNDKIFYLNNNWYGGLLTNWKSLKLKIDKIKILEKQLINYNINSIKKNIYTIQKEVNIFNNKFNGIKNMNKLPDMVIFLNYDNNLLGINECIKLGIPFICLFDNNNINPNLILYPLINNFYLDKNYNNLLKYLINCII